LIVDKEYKEQDIILLSSKELLIKFNQFLEEINIEYKVNAISFAMLLKNLKINGIRFGIHTKKCNKTEFIKKDIKNYFGI